jgi:hypothetical protein
MVNNSTNINKTDSYLSPQLTEHKKDKRSWNMTLEKMWGYLYDIST